MPLQSIEIIARSLDQCDLAEKRIKQVLVTLSMENKAHYTCEIRKSTDLRKIERFSAGVNLPLIIINGVLEYSGRLPEPQPLKLKLWNVIRFG